MLHSDVLNISFAHHHQIKTVFGDILGIDGIEHFSLDLVNPVGEMLFFSGTPQHAFEICRRGLGKYDGIISPKYYKNFEFYWWSEAAHKAYADKIKKIREGYLGLKHGFMLVRRWNNFHLIYSYATKQSDPHFQSQVINKINSFLQMGDYAYSRMRETYSIYSGNYEPPLIEKFYSFAGGKPPARYTKGFLLKNQDDLDQTKNYSGLIVVDFYERKRIITP
jgi:hypothetical protein